MPSNRAAYFVELKIRLVEIRPAAYTSPKHDEVVVRNRAAAIHLVDWANQDIGKLVFGWIKYCCVIGSDVANDVAEVGSDITRFSVGDCVLGHAIGIDPKRNRQLKGPFQLYIVL